MNLSKIIGTIGLCLVLVLGANAQDSSYANVVIEKDPRIDMLADEMSRYNEMMNTRRARNAQGFRLMVLTTSDRAQAMSVRTALLQKYPEHKVYTIFQTPFIKLKFGNFLDKKDAENMRKELQRNGVVPGNVYILPEVIEVNPDAKTDEE
jgi:hypothetical protein